MFRLQYDAEIVYLESKERDQAQELEAISREITKADQLFRQGSEQVIYDFVFIALFNYFFFFCILASNITVR